MEIGPKLFISFYSFVLGTAHNSTAFLNTYHKNISQFLDLNQLQGLYKQCHLYQPRPRPYRIENS